MIRGTEITLGDKKYIMPPANFNTLDKHDDFIKRYIEAGISGDAPKQKPGDMQTMCEVCFEAMKRNYPDMTREQFAEHVDFGNIGELFEAALKASGFVQQGATSAGK